MAEPTARCRGEKEEEEEGGGEVRGIWAEFESGPHCAQASRASNGLLFFLLSLFH
jgi:hypothetical protein